MDAERALRRGARTATARAASAGPVQGNNHDDEKAPATATSPAGALDDSSQQHDNAPAVPRFLVARKKVSRERLVGSLKFFLTCPVE